MNQHRTPNKASLLQLIAGCRQEQTQISPKRGCCFDLFRHAIELGDDHAWFAIQQQYYPLFVHWAVESLTVDVDHFVVDDLLQIALERFWCAPSAAERPLAERFSYTGQLLKYMKQCIRTACCEWQRSEHWQQRIQQQLTLTMIAPPTPRPLEQHWSQKAYASRCTAVRHWLAEHCCNEAELLVYRLTYEEALKPRQIVAQHPEHFPAVQDVYRIKQRLFRRIQRSFAWEE
jgi:hypothetical protein